MSERRIYWKDLTGQKYTRLLVVGPSERRSKHGSVYWDCICDCGGTHQVIGAQLKNGSVQSCGCLGRERRSEATRLPNSEASFNAVYSSYSLAAKKRGLCFELTKEMFKEITSKDCAYCGSPPKQKSKKSKFNYGHYLFNGIDRVDSSKGYEPNNVVPCCEYCNRMKLDYSVKFFFSHIKRILEHSKQVQDWMELL